MEGLVAKLLPFFCAASLLSGCANRSSLVQNSAREQPAVVDSLYFGTAMPGGLVSENDWQQFLAKVITPRFPKGVTSWMAEGQWQNHDSTLTREKSHVVLLVHRDAPEIERAITEIISIYKTRFHQEAVMRVRDRARVSFQ